MEKWFTEGCEHEQGTSRGAGEEAADAADVHHHPVLRDQHPFSDPVHHLQSRTGTGALLPDLPRRGQPAGDEQFRHEFLHVFPVQLRIPSHALPRHASVAHQDHPVAGAPRRHQPSRQERQSSQFRHQSLRLSVGSLIRLLHIFFFLNISHF